MISDEYVFDTEDAVIIDESELDSLIHSRITSFYSFETLSVEDTEDDLKNESSSVDDSSAESSEVLQDILFELQVTNRMMGIFLSMGIFMIAFVLYRFIMRILDKNVTSMI